jgi:hypothetical protein
MANKLALLKRYVKLRDDAITEFGRLAVKWMAEGPEYDRMECSYGLTPMFASSDVTQPILWISEMEGDVEVRMFYDEWEPVLHIADINAVFYADGRMDDR